jgi:hypothetical protein
MNGFQLPHLTLDMYICWYTNGFRPTDGQKYIEDELAHKYKLDVSNSAYAQELETRSHSASISLERLVQRNVEAMNFSGIIAGRPIYLFRLALDLFTLAADHPITDAMQRVIYGRHMRFGLPIILGDHAIWVQLGLARYHDNYTEALFDEALPHLAVENWMRKTEKRALGKFKYFTADIKSHKPDDNAMENVMALYIAHAFRTWRPLSEVFKFFKGTESDYSNARVRLVACHKDSVKKCHWSPVQVPLDESARSPAHMLGFAAQTEDDVLAWLQHHKSAMGAPMCFPPTNMGPDILFFLEVDGGSDEPTGIVCGALQVKYRSLPIEEDALPSAFNMSPLAAIEALASVTPENFFIQASGQ